MRGDMPAAAVRLANMQAVPLSEMQAKADSAPAQDNLLAAESPDAGRRTHLPESHAANTEK